MIRRNRTEYKERSPECMGRPWAYVRQPRSAASGGSLQSRVAVELLNHSIAFAGGCLEFFSVQDLHGTV